MEQFLSIFSSGALFKSAFLFFDNLDNRLLGEKPICINLANRKSV